MKAKFYFLLFTAFVMLILVPVSCSEIESTEKLTPLNPASLDEDAATWTNILLATADQIPVAPPKAVNDPAYVAELASIKDIQSKLTNAQRNSIEFWSGGGVLRWNQIFRELVAQYNLPPAPKADGSYPAPDAENPFADPGFPFSNPPYASRAYSYVTAAMYDALKSAWHYKYLYQRPAPYTVDSSVEALVPKTDLPAYPSEDAVMSGAATEILKLMFPAAVEEITLKAAEQRNAALWSGKAASSDIAAGLALGKAVSALFIARARTDGMGTAGGSKAQWDALATNATSRGDVAWQSLETPPRPPMLPFFGLRQAGVSTGVKTWIITDDDLISVRPPAPPIRGSSEMNAEIEEVKYYTSHLTRERLAIVHKWADGVNTYTPPGHWNDIALEHVRDANYSEVRAARAFALLNMTMHNAGVSCWDIKYLYFNARPSQLDPSVKTGTGVPNFPAYVSGHSTYSASAATFLAYLFPEHEAEFNEMAEEAALSRLYGGIHYRKDCMVGLDVGNAIGAFTVDKFAKLDGADN